MNALPQQPARYPMTYDLLAIDPGNVSSGFIRIREGKIVQHGQLPNSFMLAAIDGFFWNREDVMLTNELVPDHTKQAYFLPQHVAIESIQNMGMIVGAEVFETIFWVGRFVEHVSHGWNREPQLVYRNDIKLHLCGDPRAKDPNIRQALLNRWGPQGTKKAPGPTYGVAKHVWSALAVATYAIDNPPEPK